MFILFINLDDSLEFAPALLLFSALDLGRIVLHPESVAFVHSPGSFGKVGIVLIQLAQPFPGESLATGSCLEPHVVKIARGAKVLRHTNRVRQVQHSTVKYS